eukprot:TRINITY_DN41612_c0_g1_i1.p1 TRINITY_DN41612_c0_g1~~TRINITY_DN41612_c0_g1_i1.p1  ORF type:complete len:413 (+),score=38.25 TRINITY_DN41612_c0_g1_i1:34-1272(+)
MTMTRATSAFNLLGKCWQRSLHSRIVRPLKRIPTAVSASFSSQANGKDTYYIGTLEFRKVQRLDTLGTDNPDRIAVERLQEFCEEYAERYGDEASEWQRKTRKVVLSVLVCRNPDVSGPEYVTFTGMNFELSTATGSRCAEQNAIGAAVSSFIPLNYMRSIAVVDPVGSKNPLGPCGVCSEMLQKIHRESPEFRLIEFPDFENERFDLITSHFPGRLRTIYDPDTTPKELQIWTCSFCGFSENTPHATRCSNCKEDTRSLPASGPGKNQKALLKALWEMTVTCPTTQCEYVKLDELSVAIRKTHLFKKAIPRCAAALIRSRKKASKNRKDQEQILTEIQQQPDKLADSFEQLSTKEQNAFQRALKKALERSVEGLRNSGLGGILKRIEVDAPGQKRQEFAFTSFGKQYMSKL